MPQNEQAQIDDQMMELIVARVTAALREDLETILTELGEPVAPAPTLTVEQVARHLGVSRSTVYAHWSEWGGYKLGHGDKAPIRFDRDCLVLGGRSTTVKKSGRAKLAAPRRKRRRRLDMIADAPRLSQPLERLDGLV